MNIYVAIVDLVAFFGSVFIVLSLWVKRKHLK